jgi:hypothetical protein
MCGAAVHEEEHISRFHFYVFYKAHVVIAGTHPGRHAIIRLVRSRYARKSTVGFDYIAQLPGYGYGFAIASPILLDISSPWL